MNLNAPPQTARKPPADTVRRVIVLLLALLVGAVATLAVLFATGQIRFGDLSSRHVPIQDGRLAIDVTVPGSLGMTSVEFEGPGSADTLREDCTSVHYEFAGELTVESIALSCRPDNNELMNGYHGRFRALQDVPAPEGITDIETPAGDAVIFTQRYSEHTNFSKEWDEPVAILTLDEPTNNDFHTVVFRSPHASMSVKELAEIVESVRAIEP